MTIASPFDSSSDLHHEKPLVESDGSGQIRRMKRLLAVVLTTSLWVLSGLAVDSPVAKPTLTTISWLAGAWASDQHGRQTTEQWMVPAGGTMLGMSRTIAQGRTVEYEFLLLRVEANGEISYVAKPSGQAEAVFKLIHASATTVVFENPQHDFPQRISYTLHDGGKLTAAIEGTKNGKTRRVEYRYQRVPP